MKRILLLLLVIINASSFAANYTGEIRQFKQPDGSKVDVRLFGSEYYMRAEGLDSYTLIRDEQTKWICYAKLSADQKKLESTGIVYHGVQNNPSSLRSDLNIQKHLQISLEARQELIKKNQQLLDGTNQNLRLSSPQQGISLATTPINPLSGNILGLCIVVDFSDEPATLPLSAYDSLCNDLNYTNFGNNGSLRSYYRDISQGQLDYQNVVFGIFRAPQTFAYYDALPYAVGAQQILGQALNLIQQQGFDFSTLSTNPDNSIMAINLMYTGNPPTWAQGMWFHKGTYTGFTANGVHTIVYNCSPASAPLEIGTICHENGHMVCKWPDTYKYDQSEDGIGKFDIMCSSGDQNPVPPNPLFRGNVGWGSVIDMTSYVGMNYDTANSNIVYRYSNPADTNEFYLFEHRQQTGRSQEIPDQGLSVWHIDRNGDNQTLHHEVYLMHANGDIGTEIGSCYSNPYSTEFSEYTPWNSNWYDGTPSGLLIWGIDTPNVDVLPYHLGPGNAAPQLVLQYTGISNDNNNNGYPEPGETADLEVYIENHGQISSASSVITCTPTGPNAQYLTVNNNGVNMGVINLLLPYSSSINATFDPQTPVGTIIDVIFTITDNLDTASVTASIIVGRVINMNNLNQSLCSAVFFDQGTLNNYNNNVNYTKTITPNVAGNYIKAEFLSFDLENSSGCTSDYLTIYNGPNVASPVIGTYCGNSIPAIILSSDPSGALTFQFHSDSATTAPGWEAVISCSPTPGVEEYSGESISMYPNPTSGKFIIVSNSVKILSLTDALGKALNVQSTMEGNHLELDLSDVSKGVYILKYSVGNAIYGRKVIKE